MKTIFIILSLQRFLTAEDIKIASHDELDLTWILLSAALVLLMQAGFTAVETGMIRAKNSINVAIKNAIDLMFAIVIFFLVGYGFMFGDSLNGLALQVLVYLELIANMIMPFLFFKLCLRERRLQLFQVQLLRE